MRFGSTLSLYFTRRFARTILAIFALVLGLIAVIDYIELARRADARSAAEAWQVAMISLFRVPSVAEAVLPFATLFGSIAAFAIANRRLELVVARSAGVSAWQFLLPGAAVGLVIGILATTVYNPIATTLKERSVAITTLLDAAQGRSPLPSRSGPSWLRQTGTDGNSIMRAGETREQGLSLTNVTAFVFDQHGNFRERVDAVSGLLVGHEWQLRTATVTRPREAPRQTDVYQLNTTLTDTQIKEALASPETVSFWTLPELIDVTERSGLSGTRFRLQYHMLLARPLLLLAMVMIAGAVSFRFTRAAGLGGMILTGVVAGFVLYVVNEISRDLGSGGLVSPVVAAWLPAILASLISTTILLRQEDG